MTKVLQAKSDSRLVREAEDLNVYQAAFAISLEIHQATLAFPKIEQFALADQMRRASKSICANLVEGFAKQAFSQAEFKRFRLWRSDRRRKCVFG